MTKDRLDTRTARRGALTPGSKFASGFVLVPVAAVVAVVAVVAVATSSCSGHSVVAANRHHLQYS